MGITLQRAHSVWSPDAKSFAVGKLSALGEHISYTFLPHVKPDSVSCNVCPSAQVLPLMSAKNKAKLVSTSNIVRGGAGLVGVSVPPGPLAL